jgi:dihydrofolate reductase
MLSILVAVSANNLIGYDNKLPWHLPADLKYFRNVTMGHPIIMGRKTFDSIGKPLPGRRNIVITRNKDFAHDGVEVYYSVEEALKAIPGNENAFIIGGAEIFKLSFHLCDRLYITRIEHDFKGDTYFPEINWSEWRLISAEAHPADEKNAWPYVFEVYERK